MFESMQNLLWVLAVISAAVNVPSSSSAVPSFPSATNPHTKGNNNGSSISSIGGHDIEIKALSGEPAYKSVNLTWTIDDARAAPHNSPAFTVYYCEMQPWGAHRCKSKAVADNRVDDVEGADDAVRQYATTVGKLRMATKYMFHVKLQATGGAERKASGRADLGINEIGANGVFLGQSIVIPTKGFQAHATQCLPHASEIEVETGPFFGGRIVAEGGGDECGIEGDEHSDRDRYVMRIDHERCGSQVDQEQLTVRTFITVQENRGIFTHSTRRFVVVCSYQPDTLTVRASFSVPGKAGVAAVEPQWDGGDRSGRQRKFRMVGKDALVLRETEDVAAAAAAPAEEVQQVGRAQTSGFRTARRRVDVGDGIVENLVEDGGSAERLSPLKMSKYARLVHDEPQSEMDSQSNYTGLVIVASLSVILVGAIMYIAHRESAKRRRLMPDQSS